VAFASDAKHKVNGKGNVKVNGKVNDNRKLKEKLDAMAEMVNCR
jgi:hypothetical protein